MFGRLRSLAPLALASALVCALAAPAAAGLGAWAEVVRAAWAQAQATQPCLSVGTVDFGRLENGALLASRPGIRARSRDVWGTPETVRGITRAAQVVEALYPGRGDLVITDISRAEGGHLRPHRTHQNGRDVDALLYARRPGVEGARVAADIDLERLWALLMALRADPEVDRILLDRGIQGRLRTFGRDAVGAPAPLLDALFSGRGAWIRHAPGHRTHLHVRFKATASAEAALLADALRGVERVRHRVARGETLETLARRYAVPVAELAAENRLPVNARLRRGQRLFVLVPRPAAPQTDASSRRVNRGSGRPAGPG
jgi:hypothetical protein